MTAITLITKACLSFVALNPGELPRDIQQLKCMSYFSGCSLRETILDIRNETYRTPESHLDVCAQARTDGDY